MNSPLGLGSKNGFGTMYFSVDSSPSSSSAQHTAASSSSSSSNSHSSRAATMAGQSNAQQQQQQQQQPDKRESSSLFKRLLGVGGSNSNSNSSTSATRDIGSDGRSILTMDEHTVAGEIARNPQLRHLISALRSFFPTLKPMFIVYVYIGLGRDINRIYSYFSSLQIAIEGIVLDPKPNVELKGAENSQLTSCYISALLFAMFGTQTAMDGLLYLKNEDGDSVNLDNMRAQLRYYVNQLRTGHLISAFEMEQLRRSLILTGWLDGMGLPSNDMLVFELEKHPLMMSSSTTTPGIGQSVSSASSIESTVSSAKRAELKREMTDSRPIPSSFPQRTTQEDASELFMFLADKLGMPYLPMEVQIIHGGDRSESDDRIVGERILQLAIPDDEPSTLTGNESTQSTTTTSTATTAIPAATIAATTTTTTTAAMSRLNLDTIDTAPTTTVSNSRALTSQSLLPPPPSPSEPPHYDQHRFHQPVIQPKDKRKNRMFKGGWAVLSQTLGIRDKKNIPKKSSPHQQQHQHQHQHSSSTVATSAATALPPPPQQPLPELPPRPIKIQPTPMVTLPSVASDESALRLEDLLINHFYGTVITDVERQYYDEEKGRTITQSTSAWSVLELFPFWANMHENGQISMTHQLDFPEQSMVLPMMLMRYKVEYGKPPKKVKRRIAIPPVLTFTTFVNRYSSGRMKAAVGYPSTEHGQRGDGLPGYDDQEECEPLEVEYQLVLKSAVCHIGGESITSGHYIAYSLVDERSSDTQLRLERQQAAERQASQILSDSTTAATSTSTLASTSATTATAATSAATTSTTAPPPPPPPKVELDSSNEASTSVASVYNTTSAPTPAPVMASSVRVTSAEAEQAAIEDCVPSCTWLRHDDLNVAQRVRRLDTPGEQAAMFDHMASSAYILFYQLERAIIGGSGGTYGTDGTDSRGVTLNTDAQNASTDDPVPSYEQACAESAPTTPALSPILRGPETTTTTTSTTTSTSAVAAAAAAAADAHTSSLRRQNRVSRASERYQSTGIDSTPSTPPVPSPLTRPLSNTHRPPADTQQQPSQQAYSAKQPALPALPPPPSLPPHFANSSSSFAASPVSASTTPVSPYLMAMNNPSSSPYYSYYQQQQQPQQQQVISSPVIGPMSSASTRPAPTDSGAFTSTSNEPSSMAARDPPLPPPPPQSPRQPALAPPVPPKPLKLMRRGSGNN